METQFEVMQRALLSVVRGDGDGYWSDRLNQSLTGDLHKAVLAIRDALSAAVAFDQLHSDEEGS